MKLTKKEFLLAVLFAVIAFLISTKTLIMFLSGLNPVQGFLFYYVIVFVVMFILAKLGLTVFNLKIESISQVIGSVLIFFAFFLIFNWTNPYISYVATGNVNTCSQIFYQSEDGIMFFFWNSVMGITNLEVVRYLMYPLTTFLITLLGGLLLEKKVKLSP